MLNSILKNLNGHGSEAASLEAALLQLGRDRDETRGKITELKKARHQGLLDDASDAELDKIERQIDRAETRLEKLNLAEPPLLEKLTSARSAARQRRWSALHSAYLAAVGEFRAAALAAIEKHEAVVEVVSQAQREGFEGEVRATMPPTPNLNGHPVLAPDLLDNYWRTAMRYPSPTPVSPKAAPRPANAPMPGLLPGERPAGSLQHAIALDGGVSIPIEALTADRAAHDGEPLASGEVRAKVLRSGYSPADDRPQCYRGQIIRLPRWTAEKAAAGGVIEILKEEPSNHGEPQEPRAAGSLQHAIHVSSAGTDAASQGDTK